MSNTANTGFVVRTPDSVENTGLDSAVFATSEEADRAMRVLFDNRVLTYKQMAACCVAEVQLPPNTTFNAWNEAGW